MEETPEEVLTELIKIVKRVGSSVKEGLKLEGYNLSVNNGSVAGQIVPHIHFHIVPRRKEDNLFPFKQGKYKEGDTETILGKIKNFLK